jgi:hypothetical protein
MSTIIDLIGSMIIGGFVLFLGLRVNADIGSTTVAAGTNLSVQEDMIEASTILEADLRKIGYGIPDSSVAISVADSNRIRFYADINRDGSLDSVEYYVGNPLPQFTDRTVRKLYRRFNMATPTVVALYVTDFKLQYLNDDGGVVTDPRATTMLDITLGLTSPYKVADQVNREKYEYANGLWRQTRIATPNVARHG